MFKGSCYVCVLQSTQLPWSSDSSLCKTVDPENMFWCCSFTWTCICLDSLVWMAIVVKYHLCALVLTMNSQVISLGDTIKFSLSPSKSRDRLSTNVPGVPVDESNLVWWPYIFWHITSSIIDAHLIFSASLTLLWTCRSSRRSTFIDRKLGLITFFGYCYYACPFVLRNFSFFWH